MHPRAERVESKGHQRPDSPLSVVGKVSCGLPVQSGPSSLSTLRSQVQLAECAT